MNNKLIEKIKKLLALATSDNQFEAEAASKMAQSLLLKHNISMATVEASQNEFIEISEELTRQPVEAKFINSLLIEFFFIKIIHSKRDGQLLFLGTKENIEIAMFVRDFLKNSFKSLYKSENVKQAWRGKNKNSFYLGLYKGLNEQFEAQRKKAVDEAQAGNALMVVDKALVRFMNKEHSDLKSKSAARINNRNADAVENGKEHGRNLNIARGVNSANKGGATLALTGGR